MTIKMFCPKWYYLGTVPLKNQEKIKDKFSHFILNDNNFLTPDDWECNVLSSYQNEKNSDAPWDIFLKEIEPCMTEFLREMYPKSNPQLVTTDAWINKYKRGGFQENHDHILSVNDPRFCNLSLVYFYQVDDTNFKFYNREYGEYKKSGLDDVFQISIENFTSPQVKNGDLIIFPSHYEHLVNKNTGKKDRITISINFRAIP
jgi:hypothetical protein